MNNIANKTTFWSFLCQTNIVIPRLQRDYAQGRKGKESLREDFLSSIKDALCGGDDKSMKLDFVYGSGDEYGNFTPLDGQQRLTTLWLLHWYIAYKSGKLVEKSVQDKLIKFTYETRSSSTQFCKELVRLGSTIAIVDGETIADAIIRQSWMYSAWRQDPTVQSMLRMLSGEQNNKIDGIEELFINCSIEDYQRYWIGLLEPANNCPIVFYQLDIENLGQTDDLYVKMNGRGKPLTDFENFKADLINYFEEKGWATFLDPQTGYPVLMDTNWIDYFWDYKRSEITVDDLFFGFLNRFFLVRLMQNVKIQELENSEKGSSLRILYDYLYSFVNKKEERQSYNEIGFGVYKTLFEKIADPLSLFYDLRNILNNLCVLHKTNKLSLEDAVDNPYYFEKSFKIVYVEDKPFDGYFITQPQIVAFWAICHYFSKLGGTFSVKSLKQWMRIVWNTCDYNTEIRSKEAVISTIQSFEELFKDPTKPYETLCSPFLIDLLPKPNPTAFDEHIREERSKVHQMQLGSYEGTIPEFLGLTWEKVILNVEKKSVFNGNIRCLILDADNHYNWSYFDTKYLNYFEYDKKGLNSWAIRNLLLIDFDLIKNKNYKWYPKGDKRNGFWRRILVEAEKQKTIHKWLLAEPKENTKLFDAVELSSYEHKMIIGTTLLEEAVHGDGVYLAWSRVQKWVLMYHQTSWPYVLFDKERNKVINEYCNQGIISIDENIRLICGMFNSKDIWFKYNGSTFVWMANGHIKMKPDDECFIEASKCANTEKEFTIALDKLLILENYHERWREQTIKQYPYPKFRPNKKHEANKWFITDVTINDIDEKQVTVYIGADYTEVASVIFYCGIFYDDNSSNEMQRLKESIVDKLGLDLDDSNEITQQIFKSFYSDHIDDYNVIYKFFCSIVDNIKSLCERPFS